MHRQGDGLLIVACLVVGLVMVATHSGHASFVPAGWCGTRQISMTYAVHMAELEIRHLGAVVSRIVTVD